MKDYHTLLRIGINFAAILACLQRGRFALKSLLFTVGYLSFPLCKRI
ncbi:hypothetical protein OI450_12055 [Pectobacterium cacticida]|uniref:Uncharacterized protein n=1 Tax=Pectobacterium cacticida TaxID=69221 RepID=A0ABZ2GFG3_9GAMM|nr:hypothetical protein [Pectobacterium cacticida]UYX05704.1 hypothetical protein OI450_12055 [Pectobacterium cacticida]